MCACSIFRGSVPIACATGYLLRTQQPISSGVLLATAIARDAEMPTLHDDDDVTDLQAAGGLRSVRKENEQVGIRIKNVQRHAVPLLRTQHGPRPVVAKRVLCTPVQRPGLAPRAAKRC